MADHAPGLTEWARNAAPHLDVVSASVPEPHLEPGDLIAVFDTPDEARRLLLEWERIEPLDGAVGFVALGIDPDHAERLGHAGGADPEGVTGHAARRILQGAIPGAAIGAIVVGLLASALRGWDAFAGGALGGFFFGIIAGAFVAFVRRTSWGEAYRHSFVDPQMITFAVASFHSTEQDHVQRAIDASTHAGATLYRV